MTFDGKLATKRLVLRRWKKNDLEPFARLNADPEVMEYFPYPLTVEQSNAMVDRIEQGFDTDAFGLWAVELRETGTFIGYVGLCRPRFEASFTPCVEIGWRIARQYWGNGFAPEAAREAIKDGFERCDLAEILSFTSVLNKKSIRVMDKIGMTRDFQGDFAHPSLEPDHVLSQHVLYRLKRPQSLRTP